MNKVQHVPSPFMRFVNEVDRICRSPAKRQIYMRLLDKMGHNSLYHAFKAGQKDVFLTNLIELL